MRKATVGSGSLGVFRCGIVMAVAMLGGAALVADTTVEANGTLVLEAEGGTFQNRFSQDNAYKLIANEGARLVVPTKTSITNVLSGFGTFTSKDAPTGWPEADSDWFAFGDYLRTINTTIFRINNRADSDGVLNAEYCGAYWTVSEEDAGTYSFWENFYGNALLVLDGRVLLRDTQRETATAVQGIEVSAGVHELTIAFGSSSEWDVWGPFGNAAPAFRFSKTNADLLANPSQGVQWNPAVHDLKARLPDWATRYTLMNILIVNGTATLTNPADSGFTELRLTGGLKGGGTLVVEGTDRVEFGERDASLENYPVFDGDIVFGGENADAGRVVFTNMVHFARIPTGDQYDISQLRAYSLDISGDETWTPERFGGKALSAVTVANGGRLTLSGASSYDLITLEGNATVVLAQSATIHDVRGGGTLVAQDGVTVKLEYTDGRLNLKGEGTGRFELADPTALIERDYSNDISLWFDASAGESLIGYKSRKSGQTTLPENYTHYTNGYPIIEKWLDRRASQQTWCAFNARHYKYNVDQHLPELYPFVVSNGLNGLNYVSCGAFGNTVAAEWTGNLGASATENRRLPFTYYDESQVTTIDPIEQRARYVVMVFGSQQGGGIQMLGRTTTGNGASAFARAGATLSDSFMTSTTYKMWTNDVSVTASTACPNGGWQVITIDCTGGGVGLWGLGWGTSGVSNCGGQNYAEVLIFTNELSDVSRQRVERYLARKWGLEDYPDGSPRRVSLSGSGSLAISNETVAVEGTLAGTVEVEGGKVVLPRPLPDEAAIAATEPLHWFDPSARDSVVLSKDVTEGSARPDCVWGLFDRRSGKRAVGDYHLYAPADKFAETNATINMDRRPRWVGIKAGGVATNWLDYANGTGDTSGNTLRLGKLNAANEMFTGNNHTASGNNQMATSIRTGFLVQDSSRGGGVPFLDAIGAGGLVKARNRTNANSAIYGTGTDASLTSGRAWVNGLAVNPAAGKFTGAPEVFTFETTSAFPFLNYAYYGGDGNDYKGGQEIQAESLLYAEVLSDETRRDVEAYLAYKWMGRYLEGYGDWRNGMTFQGTGSVVLPGTNLVFTANGSAGTLTPTYDLGSLSVEVGTGVFVIDVSHDLAPGVYPLVRGGDLSALASWTVSLTGGQSPLKLKLIETPTAISLRVFGDGSLVIFR